MVRQRPRNKRQRSARTNMQANLRQLHRAASNLATVGTPSSDPPRLKLARVLNHKIQFHLATGAEGTNTATGDSIITIALPKENKPAVFKVDYTFLLQVLASEIGLGTASNDTLGKVALAITKVSVWGPPPHLGASSICAHVSHGPFDQAATDASSGTNRPRVSITMPRQHWITDGSSTNCLIVELVASAKSDAVSKSNFVGFVQIALAIKRVYTSSR